MCEISVVIPVYNSDECLMELHRQIASYVQVSYEVIFINDNSSDDSWKRIKDIVSQNKNVKGINLRKNFGQDSAIMAGLKFAKGKYIVIMDDDLQHSPKDIERLYNECSRGFDVCFALFEEKKQKFWKNVGSWLNGKVAEIMLKKPKSIYLSPFKILERNLVQEILSYTGPYPYVDGLILSLTNNLTQIDVAHSERYAGSSTYSFRKSISVWLKHVTGFSIIPLRVASVVGMISAITGFLLGIFYMIQYWLTENIVEGWTTLVVLILFLGGIILISLGAVGEYIGRGYLMLNRKPQYSIKEITNNE